MRLYDKFWNFNSSRYDKHAARMFSEVYKKTLELTCKYLTPDDYLLEFACGSGITTIPISRMAKQIYAMDISQRMVDIAKKKAEDEKIDNISFHVSEIFDKSLDGEKFDAITAFNVLFFFEDMEKVIERINGLLKPGGIFLSTTDCIKEDRKTQKDRVNLLNKMGIIPYMKRIKMTELKSIIESSGFELLETVNLFESRPNYFVAAKKI